MARPRKHKLVVIDDRTIMAMARDIRFTQRFPFLQKAVRSAKRPANCNTCGGSRQVVQKNIRNLNEVKTAIANLDKKKKSQLKALLDTKDARIVKPNKKGAVTLTF